MSEGALSEEALVVRVESAADVTVAADVQFRAFGQDVERQLAVSLRRSGEAIDRLCFVAETRGAIVGHVVCSRGFVGDTSAVGLGPIGVEPSVQRRGVGSALMYAAIGAADATGEPLIALLGDPGYYARFGFVAASDVNIRSPDPEWGPYFQVLPLTSMPDDLSGQFRYAASFDEL